MEMETEAADQRVQWCGLCGVVPFRVCAVITVVCCFLVNCTLGFIYTFGNMSPYVTSYLRNRTSGGDIDYADTLWLSMTLSISQHLSMPVLGLLSTRLPIKIYLCIGVAFTAASFFGSYWSVQTSFPLAVVTYGILGGIPQSILYPACVNIAMKWVPNRRGFIAGLVLTGYGIGSVAWNEVTTWYINRDNLQPDLTVGQDVFFTQQSVLNKVPGCFLLMGTVFTFTQFLCILLICEPPPSSKVVTVTNTGSEKEKLIGSRNDEEQTSFINTQKSYEAISGSGSKQQRMRTNYHPREVLKSRAFWTLWSMFTFTLVGTAVVTNFFKAYGQTFIKDDHFLTLVAAFSSGFNAAGRPFWGLLADRFGYRMVCLVTQSIFGCLVVTFVTCEQTGKAAYFVWVCAMYMTMCGLFTMIPATVFALFGPRYFHINMGLMDTHGVFSAVLTATVIPVLKDMFGWHGIFFLSFGVVFIGIMLNLSFSLRCGDNSIPAHMKADLSLI